MLLFQVEQQYTDDDDDDTEAQTDITAASHSDPAASRLATNAEHAKAAAPNAAADPSNANLLVQQTGTSHDVPHDKIGAAHDAADHSNANAVLQQTDKSRDVSHDKNRASDDDAADQSNAKSLVQQTDLLHEEGLAERQDEEASGIEEEDDGSEDAIDEAYVMAYLGRHCCSQTTSAKKDSESAVCGGTMTPVGIHGDVYACNMCGHERLESERVAELERLYDSMTTEVQE